MCVVSGGVSSQGKQIKQRQTANQKPNTNKQIKARHLLAYTQQAARDKRAAEAAILFDNNMRLFGVPHWDIFVPFALLGDMNMSSCCAFVSHTLSTQSHQSSAAFMMVSGGGDSDRNVRMHTAKLVTASGKPVCRYALGGAARSTQSEYIPLKYRDMLQNTDNNRGAPFYFYYNPHRYPLFLGGVSQSFDNPTARRDIFFASGGTERSPAALDQRLNDALAFCGGEYIDGFVLEYVCPDELDSETQLGRELQIAIDQVHSYVRQNKVRYIMASTHSHEVGRTLAGAASLDAIMLRYNMSHRKAAETISFPEALKNNIPVLAFTTTRWNELQTPASPTVTTADCIAFALQHPAVEVVLHSARDEDELDDALLPIISCSDRSQWISDSKYDDLCAYYNDEMAWNSDGYDEYPDESI